MYHYTVDFTSGLGDMSLNKLWSAQRQAFAKTIPQTVII